MPTRILTAAGAAVLALCIAACSPTLDSPTFDSAAVDVHVEAVDAAVGAEIDAQFRQPVVFDDRMGIALVAQLSAPLDLTGERVTDYRAGDVAYSDTERSVVIFLVDAVAADSGGLVRMGQLTNSPDELMNCARDCAVTLESQ